MQKSMLTRRAVVRYFSPTTANRTSLRQTTAVKFSTNYAHELSPKIPELPTFQVCVPIIGDVGTGVIRGVRVKENQFVDKDDSIALVEFDNVVCDIRADDSGFVKRIAVKSGDTVKQGDVVAEMVCGLEAPQEMQSELFENAVEEPNPMKFAWSTVVVVCLVVAFISLGL